MKISELKTFCKVVATGSFTRAAQALFITQPTATHHVQSLEQELGPLIIRSGQGLRLTDAGRHLMRIADDLFMLLGKVKEMAEPKRSGLHGTLSIAASSVMGAYFLPPFIAAMHTRYPMVNIQCDFGTAYSTALAVQDGRVDIGFAPVSPGFGKLSYTYLHREPCIMLTSLQTFSEYKKGLENARIDNLSFIFREKGTQAHESAMRWLKGQAWYPEARKPIFLSDMEAIKNTIMQGIGLTILPRSCAEAELKFGLMKELPVDEDLGFIDYFMIENPRKQEKDVTAMFKQVLKEPLPE